MLCQLVGRINRGRPMTDAEIDIAMDLRARRLVAFVPSVDDPGSLVAAPTDLGRLAMRVAVAIPSVLS